MMSRTAKSAQIDRGKSLNGFFKRIGSFIFYKSRGLLLSDRRIAM